MTDAQGWTDAQIFLTIGAVFGALVLLGIALFIWNKRLGERDELLGAWAARRGLAFAAGPQADAAIAAIPSLEGAQLTNVARGVVGGHRVTVFDAERWVRRTGVGTKGGINNRHETFVLFQLEVPAPRFTAVVVPGASQGSLATGVGLAIDALSALRLEPQEGFTRVEFTHAPSVLVEAVDETATRAVLAGGVLEHLSMRPGWRLHGEGDTLLVSWCADPRLPEDSQIEIDRADRLLDGAVVLAAAVKQSVKAMPRNPRHA